MRRLPAIGRRDPRPLPGDIDDRAELRMAITEPAKRVGSSVDEDLVDVLLKEVGTRQPASGRRPGTRLGLWRGNTAVAVPRP